MVSKVKLPIVAPVRRADLPPSDKPRTYPVPGNDPVYFFGRGIGHGAICHRQAEACCADIIYVADGISPSEVIAVREKSDLVVRLRDSEDSLRVLRQFAPRGLFAFRVDHICFADGTHWDAVAIGAVELSLHARANPHEPFSD